MLRLSFKQCLLLIALVLQRLALLATTIVLLKIGGWRKADIEGQMPNGLGLCLQLLHLIIMVILLHDEDFGGPLLSHPDLTLQDLPQSILSVCLRVVRRGLVVELI